MKFEKNPLELQEQKFDARRKRLTRLLGLILVMTVAVILTALWASFRRRTAAVKVSAPLPQNVNRRLSGYTFTRSEEGRQIFTIHAARTLAYDGGVSTVLEGVHVVIFGRQGNRHDEIQTEQCTYYNSSGALACHGAASVKLESKTQTQAPTGLQEPQPFLLETSDISYDPRRSMVSTDAPARFHFGSASGSAVGLQYDTREGSFKLIRDVRLRVSSQAGDALPIELSAGSLDYQKPSELITLQAPVECVQGSRRLAASTGTISLDRQNRVTQAKLGGGVRGLASLPSGEAHGSAAALDADFDPSTEQVRQLVATGHVGVETREQGGLRRLTAERVQVDFAGLKSRPRSGSASGHAQLILESAAGAMVAGQPNSTSAAGKKILTGAELQFAFQTTGVLENVRTVGPGRIDLIPEDRSSDRETITAGQLWIAFDQQGRPENLRGLSPTRILDQPPPHAPRSRLPCESSAAGLDAELDPATGALKTLRQHGNFEFQEGDRRASADEAVYMAAEQQLILSGHPELWDPDDRIRAEHVMMNLGAGTATGWGNVQSIHFASTSSRVSSNTPTQADPLIVLADKVVAKRQEQFIRYEGNVRAWRGANVVECSSLNVYKREQKLTSGYGVLTSFLQVPFQSGGPTAEASRKNALKETANQPVTIHADRLIYLNLGREAIYQGHVRMETQNTTLHANRLQVYLSQPLQGKDPEVEKAIAEGEVRVTQLTGRHAQGERAEYFAKAGKIVLTGGPPVIYDEQQGFLTGERLTFFIHDASLFADGGGKSQTLSKRRIPRQ